jgi:hypothetical protein
MPELERLMLHRLAELGPQVEEAYRTYDYKKVVNLLSQFMNTELSAFYFDIRKDALYCDPLSSHVRKSALTVVDHLFRCLATWLAPILVFTAEEAWLERYPEQKARTARSISNFRARRLKAGSIRSWPSAGARSAACAASSPARSNWSVRPSASAPRWRRRRRSTSRSRSARGACLGSISPRSASPPASHRRGRGADGRLPPADVPGVAVVSAARGRRQMRTLLEVFRSRDAPTRPIRR